MRGQPIAAANAAAGSSFAIEAWNLSSVVRKSTGKSKTAGLRFSVRSNSTVAGAPSFIAALRLTSVPGNPTLAAKRAKSGQGTRPEISTLFRAGNIPRLAARERARGAEAARALQRLRRVITVMVV